jgi:DNA repair protein RecO (recombination protein O)
VKDPGVATEAVVLRRFDYGESSQIARLYTRAFGRVSVLAKGIRRPNPDLLGALDLAAEGEATIRPKSGDALSLLTRWRTITGFSGQRKSLERLTAAAYCCELWAEGSHDFDPDPPLYDLLVESLGALETGDEGAVPSIVAAAALGFLRVAGFGPDFERCVGCERAAPPSAAARLSPGRGGLICARCLDPSTPGLIPLTAGERRSLAALGAASPSRAGATRLGSKERVVVRRAIDRLVEHALEKELKSARYLGDAFLVPAKRGP